jgi:methionine-gamma-lyase
MKDSKKHAIDTLCVHSGTIEDKMGAVVTPIYQVSTFKFQNAAHGAQLFRGEGEGYIYTRIGNPTVEALENSIAALEGGACGFACASGMAASHTLFTYLLKAGDHIVCSESVYGPTTTLLSTIHSRYGIDYTFVDSSNIEAVKAAMRPNTKLVFIETPGNPTLVMSDIAAIADIAHNSGAVLAVDNTFMSPALQSPFEFGADYIVHSLTKFLNGHADVVGGVVILRNASEKAAFRKVMNHVGGVLDPFNAFLVGRGIKTLKIRMERHCQSALKVAQFLESHEKVAWVRYPGLKSHPQYELGKRQMKGDGGMISFELKGGLEAGIKLMDNVKIFALAVSLGGVESLIQHPASMTHATMSKEVREQAKITDGLVRISVGIEDVDELIEDLKQALEIC